MIADWAGVAHAVDTRARIVSLVPSLTETLFTLGLGAQVVARTGFCVHPRDAVRVVPKIGGTKDPDLRRIEALAPTHLVVNIDENRREDVEAARRFVPNIVVTHPVQPEDNRRLVELLGGVFGREGEAARLADAIDAALARLVAVGQRLPRERVLYLIWKKPWMSVARETYLSATLERAGLDTLPASSARRYPEIAEAACEWTDAQRILLSTEPYAFRERDARELAAARDRPADLIDGEWTSWYGARAAEGLAALADYRLRTTFTAPGTGVPG